MSDSSRENPYQEYLDSLTVDGKDFKFYNIAKLSGDRYAKLPYSVRVLLESAVRNCDNFQVMKSDVEKILDWETNQSNGTEVPFKPSRVILQDFTGVPAVVDFAAMRDAVQRLGGDAEKINPICPADLVIDHSVQVDVARSLLRGTPNPGGGSTSANDEETQKSKLNNSYQFKRSPGSPNHSPRHNGQFNTRHRRYKYKVDPTQSPIRLPHKDKSKLVSPLCERTKSGTCDRQFCDIRLSTSSPDSMIFKPQNIFALGKKDTENYSSNALQPAARKSCRGEAGCCRQSCCQLPGNERKVCDPLCPFHKKKSAGADALEQNQEIEFERNKERFKFLKWGASAFKNMLIVPPGSGIVHQVNLEYLGRLVFCENQLLYPDSLVGTDSHTTMINGLGVVGWGAGGIEAEAVMLGQAVSMVLPEVVGYRIYGSLDPMSTSTDVVLTITKHLRQVGVVGKFVEFFGPGVAELSLADRATIANMCPEYGATVGYFPPDESTISYLRQTGRDADKVAYIESYLKASGLFRNYTDASEDPAFSKVVELDLSTVVPCCSGPKRPHDKVPVSDMMNDFNKCLTSKVGFKGFGIPEDKLSTRVPFVYEGTEYTLTHGDVVISAITSCTNTSNPSVMLGAGLLAKNAVENGLSVKPYLKTSLSPGSGVVTYYLRESGVTPFLEKLGFDIVGYGCMTCIGNSGPLPDSVGEAIEKGDLVACGVLSGNRNFEGRIHPLTRANYLASPMLVVAYALAGTVCIDFETTPLGNSPEGKPVYLRDIWPSRSQIQEVEKRVIVPALYNKVYGLITQGNDKWNGLETPPCQLYPWDENSTYIKNPPFFENMTLDVPGYRQVDNAYALLMLGDSVTTDHISPAGSIARNSPAARYLGSRGLTPKEFNSYGARRGNDNVMARGTFANIRLVNKLVSKSGPRTKHIPSGDEMDVYDAAMRYKEEGHQVIILAGKEYGSGSSRDWAAKGPYLLGVRAVLAESYERIHRSNLVGMGIIPLQYQPDENAEKHGLTGNEKFTIHIPDDLKTRQLIDVKTNSGQVIKAVCRFDTEVELEYFKNGGILNYMIRKML